MKQGEHQAFRQLADRANWREYEHRKRQWLLDHPQCTPDEYTQAMRRIAQQCGV